MTIPQININGTKASVLIEGYLKAKDALEAAITALDETAPHGRDFFNDNLYQMAVTGHNERIAVLSQMRDDLYEVAMRLDEARGV